VSFAILFRRGPPDDRYGGMYGQLTGRTRAPEYEFPLEEYDPASRKLVLDMSREIFRSENGDGPCLVLGAASGLQLTEEITAVKRNRGGTEISPAKELAEYTNPNVLDKLKKYCRGFHVGSYENHLFKRCLYLTKAREIIFIHDEKIDCPVEVGKCHFVFDQHESWRDATVKHPISIWTACEQSSYKRTRENLKNALTEGEWKLDVYSESSEYPIIIGHNKPFREHSDRIDVKPYCIST